MAETEPKPTDSILLQVFTGLKNRVNPERLGPQDLAKAVNVDLDNVGQPRMRRGFRLVDAADFHSLYHAPWDSPRMTLGVRNGVLVWIRPDYTFEPLDFDIGDAPVCYVTISDFIYYSSLVSSGKIDMRTRERLTWGGSDRWLSPVVNPTATLTPIRGKLLGPPPVATAMTEFQGRIYLAQGRVLWATELFLYDYIDRTRNFIQFEDDITLLMAVRDGLYVGTQSALYFLSGVFPQLKRVTVQMVGVVPGSGVYVPAHEIKQQLDQANFAIYGILFMTADGLCVGFDGGSVYNLTEDAVKFPDAKSAAALYRHQDGLARYVAVLDHQGAPAGSMRFGDYVDADIRRFGS